MQQLKAQLEQTLRRAVARVGAEVDDVPIQEVPDDKPGDFGSPIAFTLARTLRRNPAAIAEAIVAELELPAGVERAEAVGPYINVFVDPAAFVAGVVTAEPSAPARDLKVVIEHTSINPNKEAHVGHLRNIVLGDACARILAAAGYQVEVQNYIDDTGRQVAESLFAIDYFGADYDGGEKYDHWLGRLYVELNRAKEHDAERIERGVSELMHRLERGELRDEVAKAVRAMLQTCYRLGAEYDLLVWESDVVQSGFLQRALEILETSPYVSRPTSGKYAGALVMDVSAFIPGLEDPFVVLVRSDGNAMYVAKDIGYQFWKAGIFEGLRYALFDVQPSGKKLYSSAPDGEEHPDGRTFAHGQEIINVIDVRQSHPQLIVRTALALSGTEAGKAAFEASKHLAYEVVTLEGKPLSGRKGLTVSIDDVIEEAANRARAIVEEKNPTLERSDEVAYEVGIGALRFGMLKSEAKKIIDFRWEQALSLQGDSAPYVQYAHARACSILRAAAAELAAEARTPVGADPATEARWRAEADWQAIGQLELGLAKVLARLPERLELAARDLAPHVIAQYALELATAWNTYYNHKDEAGRPDTQVLRSPPGLREARLALVAAVRDTLARSLALLGIAAPAEM